jgi:hypothetical protein
MDCEGREGDNQGNKKGDSRETMERQTCKKADVLSKRMEARIGTTRGTKGKQAVKRRAQHPRPRQGRGIHQERRGGMEHKKGDIRKR